MKKLSKSKERTLLVIAVIEGIGIFILAVLILAVILVLYGTGPDSKKVLAYMEWKYKKDFEIIDEFTYISYTDGEPDTRRELECPGVILQDRESEGICFFAFARPFGNGDWIYEDNYARKILIYCIEQEQIEMSNEVECGKTESFAYPCLVLDDTDETAQKLQNMTIRFHELYQYNNSDHYEENFLVAGSMYLYSIEAGDISDQWLDETSHFCYDTPLEKYKAFLDRLEEERQN